MCDESRMIRAGRILVVRLLHLPRSVDTCHCCVLLLSGGMWSPPERRAHVKHLCQIASYARSTVLPPSAVSALRTTRAAADPASAAPAPEGDPDWAGPMPTANGGVIIFNIKPKDPVQVRCSFRPAPCRPVHLENFMRCQNSIAANCKQRMPRRSVASQQQSGVHVSKG